MVAILNYILINIQKEIIEIDQINISMLANWLDIQKKH